MKVNQSKLFAWLIFLFVTLVGIILSIYLSIKIQDRFTLANKAQLLFLTNSRVREIELALESIEEDMHAITALFYASPNVSEKEFIKFIEEAITHKGQYQFFGWVPEIPESQKQDYETIAESWHPNFRIVDRTSTGEYEPSTLKTYYYPLYFVFPQKEFEYRYGIDFSQTPIWSVFKKASENPDNILVYIEPNDQKKILHPLLIKAVEKTFNNSHRAKDVKGFVIASIKFHEILENLLKPPSSFLGPRISSIYLFDESLHNNSKLIYSQHTSLDNIKNITYQDMSSGKLNGLFFKRNMKLGNHEFTILHLWDDANEGPFAKEALLALFLGILTTALAGFSVWLLSNLASKGESASYLKEIRDQQSIELEAAHKNSTTLLEQFKQMHEKLISQEKIVSLGELAAGIAHEVRNPLNLVNNFSKMSVELLDELKEKINSPDQTDTIRKESTELCTLLQDNMHKIYDHGQRAERVIEGVLALARDKPGEKRITSLPDLLEDAINLSYQAMRAKNSSFNVKIVKDFDSAVKNLECNSEDLRRVFINLLNNAFYSMNLKSKQTKYYQPIIKVVTRDSEDNIEIIIKDNGMGISDEVKKQLFTPFFTTKPINEGTGLGLSLSKEIIVETHKGQISVESKLDEYALFKIILPKVSTN